MERYVLITGASGFLGGYLVKACLDRGFRVKVLVRPTSKVGHLKGLDIEMLYGDLKDDSSLGEVLKGVDTVVHAATAMSGAWQEYSESTVKGTKRLFSAALAAGVKKFIYISSIAVYDLNSCLSKKEIDEDTSYAVGEVSFYDKSKIETEKLLRESFRPEMSTVIVRPGPVYGPRDKLFPSRMGLPLGASKIIVIGNGKGNLPLVYAGNLADAVSRIVEKPLDGLRFYNVLDDDKISRRTYLGKIKSSVLPGLRVIYLPYPLALVLSSVSGMLLKLIKKQSPLKKSFLMLCSRELSYSTRKIKEDIGWKPSISSDESLRLTMAWHKEQKTPSRLADLRETFKGYKLNRTYKVGIVGGGEIAKVHIEILSKIKQIEVVAICDTNEQSAANIATQYGIASVYSQAHKMIGGAGLDAVHILTPPQFHKDIALEAIRCGLHVLIEKPMVLDAREAEEIVEEAEKSQVKVCIDHNHVFDPIMVKARGLIAGGALGTVVSVESWYGFSLGSNPGSRYMTADAKKHWAMNIPGKLYQNLLSHPLSVAADIVGYPEQLRALAVSTGVVKAMKSDELRVMFKVNDKLATISVSLSANPRYQTMTIYGTKGTIFLDFLAKTLIFDHSIAFLPKPISRSLTNINKACIIFVSTIRNTWKVVTKTFTPFDGMEVLIRQFYRSIDLDLAVPISPREGLEGMKVMDKIWEQVDL
ncbi:MAG: putative oxidoreductase YcjS [Pelotomaculum sp. PtaU1.Bin065]|nr:MAG: putative oxidoreductase YcjS [Pelotomaculum sp. PtaU1.Bin065]